MAVIGLAAFTLFALRRWRYMAALGPVLLLAALALPSSRRFIPYLAPFVGIGWGIIISLITQALLNRIGAATVAPAETSMSPTSMQLFRKARLACTKPPLQIAVAYLAVIVIFTAWFAPATGKQFVPRPAIPAQVFRDLQLLPTRLPVNSRMWTWWDNGFAIVDAAGFGVYHDGAAQYTPQTNLIAASFVQADQQAMHNIISFVDREGNLGIRRLAASATDFDNLLTRIQGVASPLGDVPVYVLYTPDMLLKYPAMRLLGAERQTTPSPAGSIGIRWLTCQRIVDDKVYCAGQTFDLRTGLIMPQATSPTSRAELTRLRRAVLVEAGRTMRRQEYANSAQLTMEIIFAAGEVKGVYLLDEPAFQSNLNQMFVLGRFDATLFKEAYNDFPYARAFRVLATSE
jgi:dolichyl-diphosphooligosaccharide--protein glycosyltransferase